MYERTITIYFIYRDLVWQEAVYIMICFCTTLVIISTIMIEFNLNLPFFLLVVPWDVSE